MSLKIIFLTELKQLMEIRANYARIRRQQGPQATNIVVSRSEKLQFPVQPHSSFLSEPSSFVLYFAGVTYVYTLTCSYAFYDITITYPF